MFIGLNKYGLDAISIRKITTMLRAAQIENEE